MLILIAAFATLFGAALGSFAGVVSARGLRASLGGRSRCDGCGRTLAWYELVPLVSYPALGGRCRTCHTAVGFRVYAWELGGALVALALTLALELALRSAAA
jgi:leader peptidase (prepilin peptidase) / N-methyltransferase